MTQLINWIFMSGFCVSCFQCAVLVQIWSCYEHASRKSKNMHYLLIDFYWAGGSWLTKSETHRWLPNTERTRKLRLKTRRREGEALDCTEKKRRRAAAVSPEHLTLLPFIGQSESNVNYKGDQNDCHKCDKWTVAVKIQVSACERGGCHWELAATRGGSDLVNDSGTLTDRNG